MKKAFLILILVLFTLPLTLAAVQDVPAPRVEITGVNATDLPTVLVTANVYDSFGQPVRDLTAANFELVGDLAARARIVRVQNITDDQLDMAVVLAIDVSSSMEGQPIEQAREAAQAFVEAMGPNDLVAVYAFSHNFQLVQEFTTDKDVLTQAIASIRAGGRTGLYQAAFNAVDLAASAPTNRRAVILLSDGAEYGGASQVGREAALEEARQRGVPVYTIGLGYGIDRTYLETLSEGTNARFIESPTPEQLAESYTDLAALLQSQYVLTLEVSVPADGTEYDLVIQATTPEGAASDGATLRAPIPVPIVSLPELPAFIGEVTEITPVIAADDPVTQVEVTIGDGDTQTLTEAPFTFTIDPETLTPDAHPIVIAATDEDGDTGTASFDVQIAPMPPRVSVEANLDQPLENVQTVTLDIGGQTPGASAAYQIDDGPATTVEEAPYAFDIDPMTLAPGAHTLHIDAANQGGGVTTLEVPFTVAALPPQITISGITAGQEISQPTEIEVSVAASQTPVTDIDIQVNGVALENTLTPADNITLSRATIDPMALAPGNATLTVRAQNAGGQASTGEVLFTVAALPPVTVFENLSEGETLEENRTVGISFISQTPVTRVTYQLDDTSLEPQTRAPWDIELDVLALGPGNHTLRVTPETTNGQQSTATVSFTVGRGPSMTQTALVPTNTPTPTPDVPATRTAVAVVTQAAEATIAFNTQVAVDATATERSFAATGTAESRATGTSQAQALAEAQSTSDMQATQARQAEMNAQGTVSFQATLEFRATQSVERRSTQQAQATLSAQVTATAEIEASRVAGTEVALAQAATENSATQTARQTVQAEAAASRQAQATATGETLQTATRQAQATVTDEAAQTATQQAGSTATAQAESTSTQQAAARATAAAGSTSTQVVAAQLAATATDEAQARQTQTTQAIASATREAQATVTRQAQISMAQTMVANATETTAAQQNATSTAEARETAAAREATQQAQAQATATQVERELRETQAQEAQAATQTIEAREQATATRQAQLVATVTRIAQVDATETRSAQETVTAEANATATQDARVTLVAQAEINAQGTASAQETRSARATLSGATQAARQTATAESRADANATATAEREAEQTQEAIAAAREATQSAQATVNAQATVDTQLTAIATEEIEPTVIAQAPTEAAEASPTAPTATPRGTLVPMEVESEASGVNQLIPILVVIVVAVVILLVIYLILRGGRDRERRP